ncbi:MAG: hypothetical protein GX802_08180 [Clostridiales bacterium]|nr:hypothetical protein [Clostridiales bacterium]
MAAGADRTPAPLFIMVFLLIASLASVPLQLVKFAITMHWLWLIIYLALYLVWVCVLAILARRIGNFQSGSLIVYPLLVLVFLGVFAVSTFKKLFRLKVTWKGQTIMTEEKTCK